MSALLNKNNLVNLSNFLEFFVLVRENGNERIIQNYRQTGEETDRENSWSFSMVYIVTCRKYFLI